MILENIKCVTAFLGAIRDHHLIFIEDSKENQRKLNILAESKQLKPNEYLNLIKTEIETLNKAIAILEKEANNG